MKKRNQGQVLLITLLILAVGLTAGLAVVSRSVTDIRISQQEEEFARAFSMAEAGIEKALIGGPLDYTDADISYKVTQENIGNSPEFNFAGATFAAGDTQTVWLIGHNVEALDPAVKYSGTKIDVYWGNKGTAPDSDQTPALEATLIYNDGVFKTARYALDPNAGRAAQNKFDSSVDNGDTLGRFKKTIDLPTSPAITYLIRLKLLYNDIPHLLAVKGVGAANNIPFQGSCFTSRATVIKSGITSSVRQCNYYKSPSGIFDYVLFSDSNLVK